MSLATRPQRNPRILQQATAGTAVLLDVDGGQYYALDEAGGRVWDLCDGRRTGAEILAILGREYDAPAETLEHDLRELLTDLIHENLAGENTQKMDGAPAGR